jgi:hypothetical protein
MQTPVNGNRVAVQRGKIDQCERSMSAIKALLGDIGSLSATGESAGALYFEVYDACTVSVSVCSKIVDLIKLGQDAGGQQEPARKLARVGLGRSWIREASLRAAGSFEAAYAELSKRRSPAVASGLADNPVDDPGGSPSDPGTERVSVQGEGAGSGGGWPLGAVVIVVIGVIALVVMLLAKS